MYEDIPGRTHALERSRSPLRAILATTVVAFLAGGALVWALAAGGKLPSLNPFASPRAVEAPVVGRVPLAAPAPASSAAVEAHQAAQQVAQVAQVQGGLDQRVAAM